MHFLVLKLITLLHVALILFCILTPASRSNYFLLLHFIAIPFIVLHWIMNNNTCCLTVAERALKKKLYGDDYKEEECFTCRLIEPVYDVTKNHSKFRAFLYILMMSVWGIAVRKLVHRRRTGKIPTWQHLFLV